MDSGYAGPSWAGPRSESKYFDTVSTSRAIDSTGTISLVTASWTRGAGVSGFIGKRVRYKSIFIRGYVLNNSTATVNHCCMMIVYDRRPTGTLPAITDVISSSGVARSYSQSNPDNEGRFLIVWRDDFLLVGSAANQYTCDTARVIDAYREIHLPMVRQTGNSAAITDYSEGALYRVEIGSSAAGTAAATASYHLRVRYIEE